MSLFKWFTNKFQQEASKFVYHFFAPEQVSGSAPSQTLAAGRHYFRLWLVEMYLKDSVNWFQEWHPAAHSMLRFRFGTQDVDIPHIAGSLNVPNFKPNNLEEVIHLNYELTTLMPFNGGTVELTAGLLGLKGDNYLSSFIQVLGDFAGLLKVPQLSVALAIAEPVSKGLQTLFAGGNGRLEIGLHQTFAEAGGGGANDLRSGYFVAARAGADQLKPADLWVHNDRLQQGPNLAASKPCEGVSYMLFRVEGREERGDWHSLSSIANPFNEAVKALSNLENERAESFIRAAAAAALTSPDLTRADHTRVAKAIKDEFDQMKKSLGLGAAPPSVPTLDKVMRKAISVEQALSEPLPTFEELFS